MKYIASILLLVLLCMHSHPDSYAQTVPELLRRPWRCLTIEPGKTGADTIIHHIYSIQVAESGRYTGMGGLQIISNGKKHSTTYRISGRLRIKEQSQKVFLTYHEGEILSQDPLPPGYSLCREKGTLYLYKDGDRRGGLLLEAVMYGCGDQIRIYR